MGHASDRVRGNRLGSTHRGKAFAIRPVIVGKHPKKIFDVHKHSLRQDAAQCRVAALHKDDTMINASRAPQDLLITNTGHLHSIHIPVLC